MKLRTNITKRFIIYMLFTTIIPLIIVSLASYIIAKSVIESRVSNYALELTNKQKEYMELMLEDVGSLIANISSVDEIKDVLANQNGSLNDYAKLATQAKIGYILSGYVNLRGLVSIDIFAQDGTHYHVGDTLNIKEIRTDVRDRIYREAYQAQRSIVWTGIEENVNANSKYTKVITAAKVLKVFDAETMKERPIGLILVNYSLDSFYEHFQQNYLGQNAYMVIVDSKHRIVFHPDRNAIGSLASPNILAKANQETASYKLDVDGTSMFVTQIHSGLSGWNLFSFVPVDALTAGTSSIANSTLLILLCCAILIIFFALSFARKVVEPIRMVTDRFKGMQENDPLSQGPLEEKYDDEVGDLIRWFNTFLASQEEKTITEEELRESREQYRSVVENLREGVFQTDNRSRIVFLNPAWSVISGHSIEEGMGQSIIDFIHPEDRDQCRAMLSRLLKRETPFWRQQTRFDVDDGSYRVVEIFASPILDAAGRVRGTTGTLNDVTEHIHFLNKLQEAKEAAEAAFEEKSEELRAEHQQLLDIIEFLPDATFVVNRDKEIIAWNKAMEKMTGVPKERVLGQGDYLYAMPFFGRKTPVLIDNLISDVELDYEYEYLERKGNTVFTEVFAPRLREGHGAYLWGTASLLINSKGDLVGAIQSIRDITERKAAEEAQAAEKERLAVTLSSIGDGVISTDTSQRILLMNKAAEEITGWTIAEAEGRFLNEILFLQEQAGGSFSTGALEGASGWENPPDHRILEARDGVRKIITENKSQIMDPNGRLLGYVLVLRDITEQNKLEARLAFSQKMEAIGQLAAGIAHEINTPLQYVGDNTVFLQNAFRDLCPAALLCQQIAGGENGNYGLQELIERAREIDNTLDIGYLVDEIPEAIAQSLDGLSRVSQIVLAMKDFSHPGKNEKTYADLNQAIQGTVVISRNEWKYIADMETELLPDLPLVNCVVDEINQVILNMIVNSSHAIADKSLLSPGGKGIIGIKTSCSGGEVHILISDTGAGIPAAILDKIYDPFFTTKEVGRGTGQGLALAHDIIVNKHNGRLHVESHTGVGTTFTISLPINGKGGLEDEKDLIR